MPQRSKPRASAWALTASAVRNDIAASGCSPPRLLAARRAPPAQGRGSKGCRDRAVASKLTSCGELARDVREDAAVAERHELLRRVDPHLRRERRDLAVGRG